MPNIASREITDSTHAHRTTMRDEPDKLNGLVNASGFVFQLAVEAAVKTSRQSHEWDVHAREYPWQTPTASGFVDLILKAGDFYLVVECKRPRGAEWVFLLPDAEQRKRSHARIRWTNTVPHRQPLSDWDDIQIHPASPESEFCVVRGQGEKDRPLLERLADPLLESVEAVSADLLALRERVASTCVVVPVILTTATLHLCQFDPEAVNLAVGTLSEGHFVEVPSVRFRKSMGGPSLPLFPEPETLGDLATGAVRTVFVVNSGHFVEWLREFITRGVAGPGPWDSARDESNAMGV